MRIGMSSSNSSSNSSIDDPSPPQQPTHPRLPSFLVDVDEEEEDTLAVGLDSSKASFSKMNHIHLNHLSSEPPLQPLLLLTKNDHHPQLQPLLNLLSEREQEQLQTNVLLQQSEALIGTLRQQVLDYSEQISVLASTQIMQSQQPRYHHQQQQEYPQQQYHVKNDDEKEGFCGDEYSHDNQFNNDVYDDDDDNHSIEILRTKLENAVLSNKVREMEASQLTHELNEAKQQIQHLLMVSQHQQQFQGIPDKSVHSTNPWTAETGEEKKENDEGKIVPRSRSLSRSSAAIDGLLLPSTFSSSPSHRMDSEDVISEATSHPDDEPVLIDHNQNQDHPMTSYSSGASSSSCSSSSSSSSFKEIDKVSSSVRRSENLPTHNEIFERSDQDHASAMENLVQQSIKQDRLVVELQARIAALQQQLQQHSSPPPTPFDLSQPSLLPSSSIQTEIEAEVTVPLEPLSASPPEHSYRGLYLSREEEMEELRRETEMFAEQVIEQDEEIEELARLLQMRDQMIVAQERTLEELRQRCHNNDINNNIGDDADDDENLSLARSSNNHSGSHDNAQNEMNRLSCEVDELTEANNALRDEVRTLRRKSQETESSLQEMDRLKQEIQEMSHQLAELRREADSLLSEKTRLTHELQEAHLKSSLELKSEIELIRSESLMTVRSLESKLKENDRTITSLRAATALACSNSTRALDDEMEVETLKAEVASLQRTVQHQALALENAGSTIRELEQMLATRNASEVAVREDEKEELLIEIENLTEQLERTHTELRKVEEQRYIIDDFKGKLEAADDAREESEKCIVDTYERKLSLLKFDKDVTIDKLRKELFDTRSQCDHELQTRLREMEQSKAQEANVREHMAIEIHEKVAQIFALERTLEAQEQLNHNMKAEMDILQGSMESKAVTRREEIEVMQQELVDLTTVAAQQERDIRSLQGLLHDQKLDYELQVHNLKETLFSKETEESDHRTAADLKMDIHVREVTERLEKLKWRNTSLTEENELLRERLQRSEEQIAREVQSENQTSNIQHLYAEQSLKLQIAETEIKDLKSSLSQATSPPSPPPPPPSSSQSLSSVVCHSATSGLCKSQVLSGGTSSSPTGSACKPPSSSRRLGFLSRRNSSISQSNQS